jgi:hypothetical protein
MSGDQDEYALEGNGEKQTPVKQIVDRGASANALRSRHGIEHLHFPCFSDNVTNLNFVEYLLKEGADPNATPKLICKDIVDQVFYVCNLVYSIALMELGSTGRKTNYN